MTSARSSLAAITPHAILRAQDLRRAKRFYEEALGLEVRGPEPPARELRVMAGSAMICIYERPEMPAPHNSVACFEVPDIEGTLAELRGRGVVFEEYDMPDVGLVTHDGIADMHGDRRAWFKDSEDNTLVIAQAR